MSTEKREQIQPRRTEGLRPIQEELERLAEELQRSAERRRELARPSGPLRLQTASS